MSPSLEELIKIAPPPQFPIAPGKAEDWTQVESEIGARLPQDFKDYTAVYGAGQWAHFFGITDPFYKWKHPQAQQSWREWMQMRLEGLVDLQKHYPEYIAQFKPHPAPNGLLAFGYDDNGGTLCWHTAGEPDSWRIVCLDEGLSNQHDVFDMSLTGFLSALLKQQIFPRTFPPDFFPILEPVFRPYTTE